MMGPIAKDVISSFGMSNMMSASTVKVPLALMTAGSLNIGNVYPTGDRFGNRPGISATDGIVGLGTPSRFLNGRCVVRVCPATSPFMLSVVLLGLVILHRSGMRGPCFRANRRLQQGHV